MSNSKLVETVLDENVSLIPEDEDDIDPGPSYENSYKSLSIAMKWLKWQKEYNSSQPLKQLHNLSAHKQRLMLSG